MSKPELLAPAGSIEALKAAVWAGADAVYLGGKSFNARAFAHNFDNDLLVEAFRFCRLYGVKVYLTMNTLLSDRELDKAIDYVSQLENICPPDAYIVQDLGLVCKMKERFPDISVHASTQMQQHSKSCAEYLNKIGVNRVVLARECTADDIAAVVKTGIETEVFIHGAVCVCQSGGCLMSSAIGGRSGNRGECAQPCRQNYNGIFPLSLKDMCLSDHIPYLCSIGVSSLKIEGRMKSPEYVYQTVKVYRKLIDENRIATKEEKRLLEQAFSRSGFSDGYFVGKTGKRMFGIRTETDKINSRRACIDIQEKKLEVKIDCVMKANISSYVKASAYGVTAECYGAVPEVAINRAITSEEVEKRLAKTGGTPYTAAAVSAYVDDGLVLPVSSVNELRRKVLAELSERIIRCNMPSRDTTPFSLKSSAPCLDVEHMYTVARFEAKIPSDKILKTAFAVCDRVELPIWLPLPESCYNEKLSPYLPRVLFEKDGMRISDLIDKMRSKGVMQITASNFSHLKYCRDLVVHGDYSLNVTNSTAASVLKRMGFTTLTISPELPPHFLMNNDCLSEYMVYGRLPLMHTKNCIIANCRKCKDADDCHIVLKDKTGAGFPVLREYDHRNIIYNSVPLYLIDKISELRGVNGRILMFTDENDEEIFKVFNCYRTRSTPYMKFTRGALKREGGVFSK